MHFTQAELKEIHDGLITLFGKKDSDIDSLEGSPNSDDTVVIMHNNINKKTTVGALVGHDIPLATVATSGSYTDLLNKPSIPAEQVNADWNATQGKAKILNKPDIPAEQVNSNWDETNSSKKSFIQNKPDLSIFEVSYIPYTGTVTENYIAEYSKLQKNRTYPSICHTVILQPLASHAINYDLTEYIKYYLSILNNSEQSIIKLEFIAYWDDSHNTFINVASIGSNVTYYGKLKQLTSTEYQVNSTKSVETRCRITMTSTEDSVSILCECLGGKVNM